MTRAWFALGAKLMARSVVPDDPEEAEKLRLYILAARRVSPAATAFRPLAAEAARLRASNTSVTSAEARKLAKSYAEVCREHDLGDPSVHARWIAAFAEFDEETRATYEYLAKIVSCVAGMRAFAQELLEHRAGVRLRGLGDDGGGRARRRPPCRRRRRPPGPCR